MGWFETYGKVRTLVASDLRAIAGVALVAAACLLVFTAPAYAQLCKGAGGNLNCDMTYYNTKVTCRPPHEGGNETVGTQPPCPKDPMPMKDTELKSFIKDYSPYLYAYARDKDNPDEPYTGLRYRGTKGDTPDTFLFIGGSKGDDQGQQGQPGNKGKQTQRFAQCVNQVQLDGGDTPEEQAKIVRLQLDNCANQYVMWGALGQGSEENDSNPTLLSGENPDAPEERISLSTHCQPLRSETDPEQEYSASHYIQLAWEKVLKNPSQHDSKRPTEPYIQGLSLEDPIDYPSDAPNITLRDIAQVDYEKINAADHPYTPRWDWEDNERDKYSPTTSVYSSDTTNSVFCAGEHEGDEKKMTKVDILAFRRDKFNTGITNRINYNTVCYNDKSPTLATAFCVEIVGYNIIPIPCWQCFGLSGQTDSENTFPPCQTGWSSNSGNDKYIVSPYIPWVGNLGQKQATCILGRNRDPEQTIDNLCKQLRKPYTPINRLKMRYHNPEEDPDNDVLYEGVPEGLTHKEYFKDHMPYPRLWDAGQSIQKTATTDATFQDPLDNYGQWTAIVGVGREGAPKGQQQGGGSSSSSSGGGEDEHKDERCLFGGWGGNVSFAGVSINVPNGITSWTELKLYQARMARDQNLVCIPRHEKAYKPGSSEALALLGSGANWTSTYISEREGENWGTPKSIEEASKGGGPQQGNKGRVSNKMTDLRQEGWSNAWRGYITAKEEAVRFPRFGGGSPSMQTGLDNAECGDIVIMEKGAVEGGKPGLAKVGRVVALNLPNKTGCDSKVPSSCAERNNCYVDVVEADNGKWPDTCGITDMFNGVKTRRLWKPNMLPEPVRRELEEDLDWIISCEDTKLSDCEMRAWNSVKLYRISEDERQGNDGQEKGN